VSETSDKPADDDDERRKAMNKACREKHMYS
jgi:hypothetical protein